MGLFSQIPEIGLDYTKLKDTIDTLTGETIRRRASHVILYDAATGGPAIATAGVIVQRTISGGTLTINSISVGQPLSATDYLCQSVQISSVRPDWTDNIGRIGVGDTNTWYSAIGPMGAQIIEAPIGGVLNLKNVIIYGSTVGDQIKFLVFNSV
jgi:hypothetical protein